MTEITVHLGDRRRSAVASTTLSSSVMARAIRDSFVKLDPRKLAGNPVILATEVVAALATLSTIYDFATAASP